MTDEAAARVAAGLTEAICACGDWESDHRSDGSCKFNGRGFDACHGGQDCHQFRPVMSAPRAHLQQQAGR